MVTDSVAPRPSAKMLGHIQHPSIPAVCVFVCVCLWNAAVHPESSSNSQGSVTFHVYIPDVFSGMQDSHHTSYLHPWIPRRDARKKTQQRTFLRLDLNGRTPTEDTDCKQQLFKVTETNRHHPPLRQNLLEHLLIICGATAMRAVGSCCCCCLTATSYPPHCKQSSSLREAFRVSR